MFNEKGTDAKKVVEGETRHQNAIASLLLDADRELVAWNRMAWKFV